MASLCRLMLQGEASTAYNNLLLLLLFFVIIFPSTRIKYATAVAAPFHTALHLVQWYCHCRLTVLKFSHLAALDTNVDLSGKKTWWMAFTHSSFTLRISTSALTSASSS